MNLKYKVCVFLGIVLFASCVSLEREEYKPPPFRAWDGKDEFYNTTSERPFVPKEWLVCKVTVSEVDAIIRQKIPYRNKEPFVRSWLTLRSMIEEGDELWEFDSPPGSWAALVGRAGYTIIRDGKSVAGMITAMN